MTYYTNSNYIEDLMTQIADVEVKKLDEVGELTNVTVYLFDNLFDSMRSHIYEDHGSFDVHTLLWHRPEWRGTILDLMKRRDEKVYLFCGYWCQLLYREERNDFCFVRCNEPVMDADHTCLLSTRVITYMMREAISDLMEPIRFGQAMARRVLGDSEEPRVKSLLTFTKGDYREICLKMEQLMIDVMSQRELWKDRFFYYALSVDENDLCSGCKEEMRKAFYVNENEEQALEWRPGKGDCLNRNCKHFLWQSFEDGYYDSTTEAWKNEPYSDNESD